MLRPETDRVSRAVNRPGTNGPELADSRLSKRCATQRPFELAHEFLDVMLYNLIQIH
jgi:hypothetical protein